MAISKDKPQILSAEVVAQSRLFKIESLDLRFSNGVERTYERMKPSGRNAVLIVPVTEQGDLLLIREYSAGTERYELGFPKGLIDEGETPTEAANRELKEEIGFGAHQLQPLKEVVLAPSYFSSRMTLFLAQDLYPEKLEGDEPEPLDIIRWPLAQAEELLTHVDFAEARSITALFLALKQLAREE
ncbi:ADP compounds hydrolase NudE [Photobacterium angustum]|uniref:ADP compounds hydrolase NudE n=2 Tax=Photobacterium angustum TaxID=661 RepID=A0A0D8RSI3_PHOAN|nr:ADP compounds hydrolase NudE [Photobacterium angustum]KJF80265.1 ADP-ribose diphosphatase [Photobacterium damselae subsp. damselae]EAS62983.1 putative MutT/nudix family protein [Vibrio angustum S14] [Photobacterium angustum S14]KJF93156.1 ADP-ribose diphosphatase [Photobacterium angustum]KJG00808.1 ADP-ribose diphosphatase [Photobacterium angustum]KJG04951.1 ADP-ribose diphosphatase [Photobacterium angustum]